LLSLANLGWAPKEAGILANFLPLDPARLDRTVFDLMRHFNPLRNVEDTLHDPVVQMAVPGAMAVVMTAAAIQAVRAIVRKPAQVALTQAVDYCFTWLPGEAGSE
jgi:hypothetical protein